jgi:hypothetical protein
MTRTSFVGFWAAIGACAASAAYAVAQLLQVFGAIPDPFDRIAIFVPSLLLAPLFVIMLGVAHDVALPSARGWRIGALVLGVMYAAMASIVYVNQLGVVIPSERIGMETYVRPWACCAFQEPMTAIDLLGYTYMSLALLLLAPTYRRRVLRWVLVANGLLAPLILLQLYWPMLVVPGAAWLILFPCAMGLIAHEFRTMSHQRTKEADAKAPSSTG